MIDRLAMSPLIEYLWGKITQFSCDGDEQFHRGIEVLGQMTRIRDMFLESRFRGFTC